MLRQAQYLSMLKFGFPLFYRRKPQGAQKCQPKLDLWSPGAHQTTLRSTCPEPADTRTGRPRGTRPPSL